MTLAGILLIALLFAGLGAGLHLLHLRSEPRTHTLVDQVNDLLPQTQCAQCGYPGCRPYAEALVEQTARIDQCPPGGATLIRSLQDLLERDVEEPPPGITFLPDPQVAFIHEAQCIGCALCLKACPVDAILGAPRFMHTVLAAECTGCALCLPPCPVDCIDLVPVRER